MAKLSSLLILFLQYWALAEALLLPRTLLLPPSEGWLLLLPALLLLPPFSASAAAIDVIVIGDSTAANYSDDPTKYPLTGWAMLLPQQFNQTGVVVRDLAAAGRSSKSFYDEQLWQQVKSTFLSPGDYVFIQFGHNDQKADLHRHTDPFTTYKHYLSLYINDTRAAMATPVLLTSISRGVWHIDGSFFKESLGDYPIAVRQLAEEFQVALIDLNEETAELFARLGEDVTQNTLFMCLPAGKYPNYRMGIHDTTHLQPEGAKQVAALAAQGIVKANLPLQAYLLVINNSTTILQ